MEQDKPEPDLAIQIAEQFKSEDFSTTATKELVHAVCERFGVANANISIALVDDEQISRLNEQFLGRNKITDCLSFDLSEKPNKKSPEDIFCCEIVVNAELAVREAQKRNHSALAEVLLYITHGLLHQLGFDDQNQEDAEKMHKTEDGILQQMGYPMVYSKGR